METAWRVMIDEPLPGLDNMARDAALLECAEQNAKPVTVLRFYRWIIPTLSLGNKQDPEKAADLDFCRRNGLDLVRRPTGGAAVLHHLELTYSLVSNDRRFFPSTNILETYLAVSRALNRGLEVLGIQAEVVERPLIPGGREDNYIQKPAPCFSAASHYEIVVRNRKIIGSAQKRLKKAFLQHGSIPVQYNWGLQAGSMRGDEEKMRETMTCISEHASGNTGFKDLLEAFLQGFAESFKAKLGVDVLTSEEREQADQLMDSFKIDY